MHSWSIKESKNYIFHYHKDSVAENMIDEIINNQEYCFNHISKVLNINFGTKIKYYLCNSSEEVGAIYGDNEPCNAFARKPNEIFALVNEEVQCIGYHEDSHILSYSISTPKQVFIREGLAMYFDKHHWGISNSNWVSYFTASKKYISISALISNEEFYKYPWNITYPIAGAFTDYLITIYGIEKYIEFYKVLDSDFEGCFYKVFGIGFKQFEDNFIHYISSLKTSKELFKLLESLM
ncbi:hypothetical protein CHL78_006030 [Romboutsia weinsteinii]|uniref:Peptidase MA-like domain-containing protein n=1 Tax=Romboutsia weinsteinii TaxID=2020949 RepID=A0A371J5U0_9FIRM|nr:hypothetical protein [Romboutsia weinsteinii]RDY28150.1 hypothetical protein CHL78_006030 [Romboutsia weinsteinii]